MFVNLEKKIQNWVAQKDVEMLIGVLGNKRKFSSEHMKVAAAALGGIGDRQATAALIAEMKDRANWASNEAAVALGRIGGKEALEALINVVRTEDRSSLVNAAILALGKIGDREAVVPLIEELEKHPSHGEPDKVIEALAALGDPRAIGPIRGYFERGGRASALNALIALRAMDVFVGALDDPNRCGDAIFALGEIGETRAVAPLLAKLADPDKDIRTSAARALEKLGESQWVGLIKGDARDFDRIKQNGDARFAEILHQALADPTKKNKGALLESLHALDIDVAVDLLIALLEDNETKTRLKAVESLSKKGAGSLKAVPRLIERLKDADPEVQAASVKALAEIGDAQAIQPLIDILFAKKAELRVKAAKAVAKLGEANWEAIVLGQNDDFERLGSSADARVFEPLLNLANDESPEIRKAAAAALAHFDDVRAVEALIGLTRDRDDGVRQTAEESLGKMGDGEAVRQTIPRLVNDLSAEHPVVRKNAAHVLGLMKKSQVLDPLMARLVERRIVAGVQGPLNTNQVLDPLIARLSDDDVSVKKEAAWALGGIGDIRAIEPLLTALTDQDCQIAAAGALEKLGEPKWIKMRRTGLQWGDYDLYEVNDFDLAELAKVKDRRLTQAFLNLLFDENGDRRKLAAEGLMNLGEWKWNDVIKGDKSDFERLARREDERTVERLAVLLSRSKDPYLINLISNSLDNIRKKSSGSVEARFQKLWDSALQRLTSRHIESKEGIARILALSPDVPKLQKEIRSIFNRGLDLLELLPSETSSEANAALAGEFFRSAARFLPYSKILIYEHNVYPCSYEYYTEKGSFLCGKTGTKSDELDTSRICREETYESLLVRSGEGSYWLLTSGKILQVKTKDYKFYRSIRSRGTKWQSYQWVFELDKILPPSPNAREAVESCCSSLLCIFQSLHMGDDRAAKSLRARLNATRKKK